MNFTSYAILAVWVVSMALWTWYSFGRKRD